MKTMNRAVLTACLGLLSLGSLAARGTGDKNITIYAINGPSGIGLIRLFDAPPEVLGFTVKVERVAQADQMAARLISGEAKIGVLPANTAAKIAASGRNLKLAAVIGNGMLSLLTTDNSIQSIADLAGKKVDVAGHGATPDYVLRKILTAQGLDKDKDVNLSYSLAIPEIAQSLIAGRLTTALLPEPFATMVRARLPTVRQLGNIQEQWAHAVGGTEAYPMTVLVVDGDFAAAYPGALRDILSAIKSSIDWVLANPAEAGNLAEKNRLGLSAEVVAASIPRSNFVFIPAAQARPALTALFETFLEFEPSSIGGSLPDEQFYYQP
ncbi:ABC transporter substrate-binding protein [Breznakiellaceae bacterium SP9]